MKKIGLKIAVLAGLAMFALTAVPTDASAATDGGYRAKKAECTRKANDMSWGIHRIKRHRWIKRCIATS
jgi:hypothetical protein